MDDEMQEIVKDFLVESTEMIDVLDQRFVDLEADPSNAELLNEVFRAMHSMKGSAGFLGFTRLVDVSHRAENLLNKLRQGDIEATPDVITVILETVDVIKLLMADIRESGTDEHVDTEQMSIKLEQVLSGGMVASPPEATAAPPGAPEAAAGG